jgi:L-proline amide hydrolase
MTPTLVRPLAEGISGAKWVIFENSAHMAMVEEPDRYRQVLQSWLSRAEAAQA